MATRDDGQFWRDACSGSVAASMQAHLNGTPACGDACMKAWSVRAGRQVTTKAGS